MVQKSEERGWERERVYTQRRLLADLCLLLNRENSTFDIAQAPREIHVKNERDILFLFYEVINISGKSLILKIRNWSKVF